ncbi:MAG: extracellular solute-binding protein [Clostridiaceae bacterium]|nr:extracellular solute-binding protein [Clostridiaceae bacterium]
MGEKYELFKNMTDKMPAMGNNFLTIKSQLQDMVKDPFSIARRLNDLENAQSSLGAWYLSLQSQPLFIDYMRAMDPDEDWKNKQANIFQKIYATVVNFIMSFIKDYDNVGSVLSKDVEIKSTIDVWIARGMEWAELIKEMADESFTPKTGIRVDINILPANQLAAGSVNALMLAIVAGRAPDVGLGVGSGDPVEFAIRDAVVDLSQFDDFEEVSKRFLENIFIPYRFRGGVYALPETMDISILFYRKDTISKLGIKIPDTREELYAYVLPALYQNGMQFYYPHDFSHFIFQHGGDYYTPDGRKSALDTPEAYQAFKEYTEIFTSYGIPVTASFYNRFRQGIMPMGIGNFSLYMQLSVAAPELAGRWGIAPLPATRKPDGTIDRSNGALAGQCDIILKQSKKQQEAWEFLKWWTSEPVQTQFARELEAIIGAEARWNTANVESFTRLSWKPEDLSVIQEQWKWAKEIPVVLGGYYTGRYITNAWNSVVISGANVRDALENAVKEINRELRMKQEEYGIFDSQR